MTTYPSIDPTATADLARPRMSEIVLRTTNLDRLRDWYQLVLSAERTFEYDVPDEKAFSDDRTVNFHRLCFLRVYSEFPYTEVLALFQMPNLKYCETNLGLHHMQFRCGTLDALVERYDRLVTFGIFPYRSHNHGPSVSFYYEDPDGNMVELSGPNFEREEDYRGYFQSQAFANNPAGIPIDAPTFVHLLKSGTDRAKLLTIG